MAKQENLDFLNKVVEYSAKPPLFEPGEKLFWDDPHISRGMLDAHLNPDNDLASRKHSTIDREVDHLVSSGILKPGDRVLDLGCGPGLYASRLAEKGMKVTGVDISERSLNYAIAQAKEKGHDIVYRLLNFFDIDYTGEFDAVIQVYGELGTLSDEKRDVLLVKIHEALKPGSRLVFDVTTGVPDPKEGPQNHWYVIDGGFWRPGRNLVLDQQFDYPENNVHVDQTIVIDEKGISVYRTWIHRYTLDSIKPVLLKAGFEIIHAWNDLAGTPYQEGGEWIALVARKSQIRPANNPDTDYKAIVRDSYDTLAAEYEEIRQTESLSWLMRLTDRLSGGDSVLDIGCGVGIPVARALARHFTVTGVDISRRMIERAKTNVPDARFVNSDIMSVEFPASHFNAVVSFYSIIHIPREEHPELLKRIYRWLKSGGYLLATFSYCDDAPYTGDYHGVTMYWSNYGLEEYKKLVVEAGFTILHVIDIDDEPDERYPLFLAQKD